MIWTEKYRPTDFSQIVGQEHIIPRIKAFVEKKNLPHMLFAGPAGVGKTTLALVIARKLFGNSWRRYLLELNASVTPDTPIMIKKNGVIKRTNFAELDKIYFKSHHMNRVFVNDLEILSINKDLNIAFQPVSYIFRHKKREIIQINYEGGSVKTSPDHSLIVIDDYGRFVPKKASEIKKGDLLISFKTHLKGNVNKIDLRKYTKYSSIKENPKLKKIFDKINLTQNFAWMLGFYLAEGCTAINENTRGQIIFTVGQKERKYLKKLADMFSLLGLNFRINKAKSGFDRNKETANHFRVCNTQLTKFFRNAFYDSNSKTAKHKKIPEFVFSAADNIKQAFIRGYFDGDGTGVWGKVARIISTSKNCLIDTAWLGRLAGFETSVFGREVRIIQPNEDFTYIKSELLPAKPFHKLNEKFGLEETYLLRHSLYSKKSKRITKNIARKLLKNLSDKNRLVKNLKKLVHSDLYVVMVTSVKKIKYEGYVYDVSVPGIEMFWGGSTPILLHNSDERGIDIIRNKVKDFARTKALGGIPFKIIYLDESDALTRDAQQALRRTMELFTKTCRFILSCNFSSKIIDPIQSRCAIFRFKPLPEEALYEIINTIAQKEGLEIDEQAKKELINVSGGDCRKLTNILQSCSVLSKQITVNDVYQIISYATPTEIKTILEKAIKGDFITARKLLLDTMLKHGLSGQDMIKQIHQTIWQLPIKDEKKIKLIELCAEIEFRLTEGSDEFLQLEALLAQFVLAGKH